ncbi:xanthine dehydrogenase family protein molybdopterin-binding subunit [Cupriavidus sp. AU9028]|nr:xanthine dehydrogenase family protein molybdopterin-binding subunit [Cupriavidus sp. AU9028]
MNPISAAKPGTDRRIGADAPRVDAHDKVTGRLRYAADHTPPRLTHACVVTATIGKGVIRRIDTATAARVPGVLLILTHDNMDRLQPVGFVLAGGHAFQSRPPLQSRRVAYRGEIVALVVAESAEAAAQAAADIRVDALAEPFAVNMDAALAQTVDQSSAIPLPFTADKAFGDADRALAGVDVVVEREYRVPAQHQNPMELLATVAEWTGGELTVHESTQAADAVRHGLARQFGLAAERVRVLSPSIGGGFGQKNSLMPHTTLAAAAARRLGRPVKLVLPRAQAYHNASFRPASLHRIRLGGNRDGRMVAAIHESRSQTSRFDLMPALGTDITARMYDLAHFRGHERLVRLDTQTPGFMRAPYELAASFALESAVDELATRLAIDPVALRLLNDTPRDPLTGKPFSSRRLSDCLRRGAQRFGWSQRSLRPGSMRAADGSLVGFGVAAGAYKAATAPAMARVRLHADGTVDAAVGVHEMGQGARTAIAVTIAEVLGVDASRVRLTVGDTSAPPQHLTAGSWGTATAVPAVQQAALAVRAALFELARTTPSSPLHRVPPSAIQLDGAALRSAGGATVPIRDLLYDARQQSIEREARWQAPGQPAEAMQRAMQGLAAAQGPEYAGFVAMSYAAQFAEVHVNARTGQVRVARALGVFDCGRVVSRRTARSQALGGLVWGIGAALAEQSEVDPRFGGFLNADIAEYLVPVHADIGELEVDFIDEADPLLNAAGVKGLGEVVTVGAAAAIANALYHATGHRFTSLPIRIEEVRHALSPVGGTPTT